MRKIVYSNEVRKNLILNRGEKKIMLNRGEKKSYTQEVRKNLMLNRGEKKLNRGETDENEVVVLWRLPINFGCQLFPPTPPYQPDQF